MRVETLSIHLNNLLLDNQLVAVAELDGKIVEEVVKERKAELLTVQPDEDALGFYARLDSHLELFLGEVVWVSVRSYGKSEPPNFGWDNVKTLTRGGSLSEFIQHMVLGLQGQRRRNTPLRRIPTTPSGTFWVEKASLYFSGAG